MYTKSHRSGRLITAVALPDVLVGELLALLDLLVVLVAGALVGELLGPLEHLVGTLLPLLAVEELLIGYARLLETQP